MWPRWSAWRPGAPVAPRREPQLRVRRRLGRDLARNDPSRPAASYPELWITSMMGGLSRGLELNTFEIAGELAAASAQCSYLAAPIYAGTPRSRDTILAQEVYKEVLAGRRDRAAILSMGDLTPRRSSSGTACRAMCRPELRRGRGRRRARAVHRCQRPPDRLRDQPARDRVAARAAAQDADGHAGRRRHEQVPVIAAACAAVSVLISDERPRGARDRGG